MFIQEGATGTWIGLLFGMEISLTGYFQTTRKWAYPSPYNSPPSKVVVPARWNHCDTLTSRMLLLVLRKISGDHVLGLCWEARHLLTWQPILTLYSKLKGGMRERDHRK